MEGDSEEKEHFLPQHSGGHGDKACKCRRRQTLLVHTLFLMLHVCLLGIVLVLVYPMLGRDNSMNALTLTGERVALRRQPFVLTDESPYAGPPGTEIDGAWTDLLDHVNLRAWDGELLPSNQTSVALPDGGSLVWMDVSHQLHCVKYLRQWIYRDYYHPEVGPDETSHILLHTDHCLDLLRQALMCRADTSLMTFHWAAERREPMLKLESPQHVCVDWEDLMAKVASRRVSDGDMAALTNPDFAGA